MATKKLSGTENQDRKSSFKKALFPKKWKNNDMKVREARAGYLMTAPALILIFLIALWPVIQSFYFSLFDYRLNDPTKSSPSFSYSINLEHYLQNYPILLYNVENEIFNGNAVTELEGIKQDLLSLDQLLRGNEEIQAKYDYINDKLNSFEKVSSDESRIVIDRESAKKYDEIVQQLEEKVKNVANAEQLLQADKITGLTTALNDALIKPNFVGFDNYTKSLSDGRTWSALWNTTVFTVISVALELVIGLAIAILINKEFKGRGIVRAAVLIPWAIPTAVSALMWKFLYDGQNGIVAKIFEQIGLIENMELLLTTKGGAMFSIIFSDVWKTTPYMALLLLAGLQTIPNSLYESARVDGAGKWRQFFSITLPLLKPSLLVALLFRTLDAFRVFDLIYVLTGGGPANSTESISILAYKVMFSQTNFGEGSALSVLVFICVAIISGFYVKLLGKGLLQR